MLIRLDATLVPDGCSLAPAQSVSNFCPWSEWESIQEFLALSDSEEPAKYQGIYDTVDQPSYFMVSGKESQRQQYLTNFETYDPYIAPVSSTTPMVVTADALTTTSALWYQSLDNVTHKSGHGSPFSDQSNSIHTLNGDSFQGFTAGSCVSKAYQNTTDTTPILFPFLYLVNNPATRIVNRTTSDNHTYSFIPHPGLSPANVFKSARHPFEYQLQWVDLPQPLFNGSSLGAVIILPQVVDSTSDSDGAQILTVCNLAAGWGSTALQTEQNIGIGGSSVSSTVTNDSFHTFGSYSAAAAGAAGREPTTESADAKIQFYYPGYPQRFINITQEWARYLDPMVESANNSVFNLLMEERFTAQGWESIESFNVFAAETLVLMVTNGLARIGYESTLQGSPKSIPGTPFIDGNYWLSGKGNVFVVDPVESQDWVKFHVNSTLQGYAYNTETLSPRLAIAVMTVYCIIALVHVIYSGITGRVFPQYLMQSLSFPSYWALRLIIAAFTRNQLHLLGFHRRSHHAGHELDSNKSPTQHLCWHNGAPHLPITRPHICQAG